MLEQTSLLRKRTKTLSANALSGAAGDASSRAGESQLPSPLSSIDENMTAVVGEPAIREPSSSRNYPRRRRSSTKGIRRTRSTSKLDGASASDTQWIDIPLAVALIPPLGSFLTGGDFLRDFLLFILLFFYLHQLIKLPWDLYLASRPRGRRVFSPDTTPEQERLHDVAESELRTAEFCYLTFSVLTPLLGASLLRYVGTALTGKDYISWFSTGVFVLVTGVRPWRHLSQRLRSRTEELQSVVHTFRVDDDALDMPSRMERLEEEIKLVKREMATKSDVVALNKEVDESLDVIDAAVGKHERVVELEKRSTEERFAALEKALDEALREVRGTSHAWTLGSPRTFWEWIRPQAFAPSRTSPTISPTRGRRPGYRPRLAAVREEEDGTGQIRVQVASKARVQRDVSQGWLDMLLFPFTAGRTLLWGILDFLQRRLV